MTMELQLTAALVFSNSQSLVSRGDATASIDPSELSLSEYVSCEVPPRSGKRGIAPFVKFQVGKGASGHSSSASVLKLISARPAQDLELTTVRNPFNHSFRLL